jgi:uncharacterized protein (DUF1697 family)
VIQRISRTQLRAEVARRLPFECDIMICDGRDVLRLVAQDCFAGQPVRRDTVRFVGLLSRLPRAAPPLPMHLPSRGRWLVQVLARDGRFLVGLYRRQMQVLRYLGTLDRIFGTTLTTRSWSTVTTIAKVLAAP